MAFSHAVSVTSTRQPKDVRVNAVFNSEVRRSFITTSLVIALRLVPIGARKVKWISQEGESISTRAEYYRIGVLCDYGELIDTYEWCSLGLSVPTMAYELVERDPVLSERRVIPKSVTATMLIGADNHGAVCVSKIAGLGSNAMLYQSRVGYMRSTVRHEAAENTLHRHSLEAKTGSRG